MDTEILNNGDGIVQTLSTLVFFIGLLLVAAALTDYFNNK